MPPFPRAEAARDRRGRARRAARRALRRASASRSPPPRSRRSTRPRCAATAHEVVAVKVLRPGMRGASRATCRPCLRRRAPVRAPAPEPRRLRPVEVVETLARSVAIEMDLRLEAAALPRWPRTPATTRISACRGRLGPDRARRPDASNGSTASALSDLAAIEAAGHDRAALGRDVDPVLPAACASATASSMPTCIPGTSSSTRRAASSPSISASWAGSA